MCGIIGYLGSQRASTILVNGLKRMEYRGYDSAGLSVLENGEIKTIKQAGKVNELDCLINHESLASTVGIAHTRWATHGEPTDVNAHPHHDSSNGFSIVHNGIIENYSIIKKQLLSMGYTFVSETDSEVIAVLIGAYYDKLGDAEEAVRSALSDLRGTFGILALSKHEPDKIIAARRGSPMVLGIGNNEFVVASDAAAIIQFTRQVIYLSDNEIAVISRDGFATKNLDNEPTNNQIHNIDFNLEQIEKSGYEHFMLKEIFEQPTTFGDAFRGRLIGEDGSVRLGGLRPAADALRKAGRVLFVACGTSWHAAQVGEYLIESLCRIPCETEYASEFRYRNPVIFPDDVVFVLSQSGETADTLAAVREAKRKGATVLGIVNVVGSTIARETDGGIFIHAGPEIGVASTKAFTSQIAVLTLLALHIAGMKNVNSAPCLEISREMRSIPAKIEKILASAEKIKEISRKYKNAGNFLYLGRGVNFPVALEGALKLKEISYIHAEGYPAAEMKHGPIALIDENMPVVIIATKDEIYEKVLSNIEEVRARKGRVIAIANEGDAEIGKFSEDVIYIPATLSLLTPVLSVIPLQLMAYYTAVELGCNVDQPRNLAKSVTVE